MITSLPADAASAISKKIPAELDQVEFCEPIEFSVSGTVPYVILYTVPYRHVELSLYTVLTVGVI
jgi:hypothetical protein